MGGTVPVAMADQAGEKARRRAARAFVGDYHERELTALLEHVRDIADVRYSGDLRSNPPEIRDGRKIESLVFGDQRG